MNPVNSFKMACFWGCFFHGQKVNGKSRVEIKGGGYGSMEQNNFGVYASALFYPSFWF